MPMRLSPGWAKQLAPPTQPENYTDILGWLNYLLNRPELSVGPAMVDVGKGSYFGKQLRAQILGTDNPLTKQGQPSWGRPMWGDKKPTLQEVLDVAKPTSPDLNVPQTQPGWSEIVHGEGLDERGALVEMIMEALSMSSQQ